MADGEEAGGAIFPCLAEGDEASVGAVACGNRPAKLCAARSLWQEVSSRKPNNNKTWPVRCTEFILCNPIRAIPEPPASTPARQMRAALWTLQEPRSNHRSTAVTSAPVTPPQQAIEALTETRCFNFTNERCEGQLQKGLPEARSGYEVITQISDISLRKFA